MHNPKKFFIIKTDIRYWIFAAFNALLLLVVCYLVDNIGISLLNGPTTGQYIDESKELLADLLLDDEDPDSVAPWRSYPARAIQKSENVVLDDYVLVNVAYDKVLVPVDDDYGLPKGNIDIADRKKLADFLAATNNAHRYILLDVELAEPYFSPDDSLLIETIIETPNIAIAKSSDRQLIDPRLLQKAAFTDYDASILETNFVKYDFLRDSLDAMAYKAYKEIAHPRPLKKYGPFYFKDNHLQWKSLILRFPVTLRNPLVEENSNESARFDESKLMNLGSGILDMEMDIPDLVKDKIVVIGDFTEYDIHTTYIGKLAGPVININALNSLMNEELTIPWWLIISLWVFYSIVGFLILKQVKVFNIMKKLKLDKPVIQDLVSLIGFSTLFAIVAAIVYLSCRKDINVFIPALWFTALKMIIDYIWKKRADSYS